MTTSTYKHFGMAGKQASPNIHSNTERTVSPSMFKKTTALIFLVVTATTLFLHERTNNTSGQENHICRVESTSSKELIYSLSERLYSQHPKLPQLIKKLNEKFPDERESIIEILGKINTSTEPQDFQEENVLIDIFECLSLSSKEDKEEFKAKFASGFLERFVIDGDKLEKICIKAINSKGDNTKTLETMFELLTLEELKLKEIKEALVENFSIVLLDFDFSIFNENHHNKIREMFAGGDKNKHRELIEEWNSSEEEIYEESESALNFVNSLTLGQERIYVEDLIKSYNMTKSFRKLFNDCLVSLISKNNDDSKTDKIIDRFNNNNKDISIKIWVEYFNVLRNVIIKRFKALIEKGIENTLLEQFVKKLQESVLEKGIGE